MPRCVECGTIVEWIVNPDTNTTEICENCGDSCDIYYEFGTTQKWIDIALLRTRAWAHVIFNDDFATSNYFLIAILGCFLEAFVMRSASVLTSAGPTMRPDDAHQKSNVSLRLVGIIQGPLLDTMNYRNTLPQLFFYALLEFLLLVSVSVWVGNSFKPRDAKYEEVLGLRIRAVSMASCVKLTYILFLIWNIPLSSVPAVDLLFFAWLARGLSVVPNSAWLAIPGIILCSAARMIFRRLTEWFPPLTL